MTSKGIAHQVGTMEVSPLDGVIEVSRLHKGISRKVSMLPHHTSVQHTNRKLQYLPLNQSYSTFFQGSEVQYTSLIDRASLGLVAHMYLHVRIANSSAAAARLIPMSMWFNRIELWASASGDMLLQRWHPESLLFRHCFLSHETMEDLSQVEAMEMNFSEETDVHPVSTTRDYWLPLFGSFADSSPFGVDLANIDSDLQIRMWTRPYIDGTQTTPSSVLTVSAMDLYVEEIDDKRMRLPAASKAIGMRYLETIDLSQTVTLAPSTKTTVTLEQLNGFTVPFILLGVRATTANHVDSSITKFWDLGRNATVSLVNQAGTSIVSGNPINIDFLRHVMQAADMPGDITNSLGWFVLSFSHDLVGDLHGNVSGYHSFDSTTYRLEITPGADTGVAQIQTVTSTLTGGDDQWTFGYKGHFTTLVEAGTDISATVKAAIEALPSIKEDRITVTPGANWATATSTISIMGPNKYTRYPLISAFRRTKSGAVAGEFCSVAQTTAPVRGIATGSNSYQLLLMPFVVKECTLHAGTWHSRYLN